MSDTGTTVPAASPARPNAGRLVEVGDGTFVVGTDFGGTCFGCGPANRDGLRLRFRFLDDGRVSTTVFVPAHLCGMAGVVHGGVQSTILDEVSGVAAQTALPEGSGTAPCVTAELSVRFRRPVSQVTPVTAVARAVRVDGRSIHVEAAIVDGDGAELTTATSRWVQLPA